MCILHVSRAQNNNNNSEMKHDKENDNNVDEDETGHSSTKGSKAEEPELVGAKGGADHARTCVRCLSVTLKMKSQPQK